MRNLKLAAGLAACLMALSGCGDSAENLPGTTGGTGTGTNGGNGTTIPDGASVDTDGDGDVDGKALDTNGDKIADAIDTNADGLSDGPLPAGATVVGGTATTGGDSSGSGSTATSGGSASAGTNNPSTGGEDGGTTGGTSAGSSGCTDDPDTYGNDCPGVVTCTDAVDECSVTTQNCCVKDYKMDAVSCNEGSSCDGLASATCDGPEDCSGGKVCCISVSVGLSGSQINHRCVADANACSSGLITNSILCHSDDDCASGQSCDPIGQFPWWGICK